MGRNPVESPGSEVPGPGGLVVPGAEDGSESGVREPEHVPGPGPHDGRATTLDRVLRLMGAIQVAVGVVVVVLMQFLAGPDRLEAAAAEIQVSARAVESMALSLLLLIILSGVVSLLRVRWGWYYTFTAGSIVLLMGLLQGPRTLLMTKLSFLVMMALALLTWAAGVVHYHRDLYH